MNTKYSFHSPSVEIPILASQTLINAILNQTRYHIYASAQTNNPDPKTALLDLLKVKHDYERTLTLGKKFDTVPYKAKYKSPLSSTHDIRNRISLLTYFKAVKLSLEGSKDILPPLREISK
ncbi:MAG TPA: hypothetical protein VK541_11670 [Pedobacter sp.]|uniref:hypothetical protein n=1 Tax=Pedobacter sp. TaxID=1411316 RepID=UPI002D1AC8D6|nr:hypothetical protein [Pedobacter sp.]HMI03135.1 hypothetical protein [Pedobacter sp.]